MLPNSNDTPRGAVVAEGKTKTLYETPDDPSLLIMEFRDDTTAFDGKRKESLPDKGAVNNAFNAHIMQLLAAEGIAVHWVQRLDARSSLVRRLNMLPLEAVLRNTASGSICRRLGTPEGTDLTPPIFEFFYKDDNLGDPMVNESHALTFGWATEDQMQQMQHQCRKVNTILSQTFATAGLKLVDYKLEFGTTPDGNIVLGDEFTPDGARIWSSSGEKLDKDRFRQNLGKVTESYRLIAELLNVPNLPPPRT